jgi:hypothetical protein
VTAASEHAAPDHERAETYIRLLAEAELRRALAMPEYKPRRQDRAPRGIFLTAQARRMRRRRAAIDRIMRQQSAGGKLAGNQSVPTHEPNARAIPLRPVIRRVAKSLGNARTLIAAPTTALLQSGTRMRHQLSARALGVTWPLRRQLPQWFVRHGGYEPPQAESCLTRVETVASVLAAVGAITAQSEEYVVGGLRAALAARSRIDQDDLLSYHRFRGHPMRRRHPRTVVPSGQTRAIPVGASANGEIDGAAVRFYLGVLVIDQGSVTLTVRARFPAELEERDGGTINPVYSALSETSAVDDRGSSYQADFSGGGGAGEWDGRFQLSPTPPPGVRWLDMTLPGAPVVRVSLDAPSRDLRITTEQITTSAADRFLDGQTMELFSYGTRAAWTGEDEGEEPTLFWLASHLLAAGVLTTDSPSLRRLAAVAAQTGKHLPGQLSLIEPDALPADWLSLQAAADRHDSPAGVIPVAAVLPEVDGAQCVIAELVSEADCATLQVLCTGWPEPRRHGRVRIEQFSWSARDDLGDRYVSQEGSWSYSNGHADLDLRFCPAINPQARELDIILTGTTTQVTVTVLLDWQESL